MSPTTALIDLVLHRAPTGQVFNVGSGVETSGQELAEAVLELAAKPVSLIQYVADRKGHDYYALDTSKIAGELGWKPQIGLRDGLARTVEVRRQPDLVASRPKSRVLGVLPPQLRPLRPA